MSDTAMHTPGPWQANVLDNGHYTVSTEGWRNICQLARNSFPEQANARLIAAAPELLEAVKRIMPQSLTGNPTLDVQREYWEYEMSQGRGEAEDVLFALAAIAKAEGK